MAQPYNKTVRVHRFTDWSGFLDMLNSAAHEK
jgi:hypothetical protein